MKTVVDSVMPREVGIVGEDNRSVELLRAEAIRAGWSFGTRNRVRETHVCVGDKVMVARGEAVVGAIKWPALWSKFYGPCEVISVSHPSYILKSSHGRITRRGIHARRLVRFYDRPAHLLSR